MYIEKSVLEYQVNREAFLVARDRHRQIYMETSGNSFLILNSHTQNIEIIDASDKFAVSRMKDELLLIASQYSPGGQSIEVDVEYVQNFKNAQLEERLDQTEMELYDTLLSHEDQIKSHSELYINLDDIDELQELLNSAEKIGDFSLRAITYDTSKGVRQLNLPFTGSYAMDIRDKVSSEGLFNMLNNWEITEDNSTTDYDDVDFSNFESLDTFLAYENKTSHLEISESNLRRLDSDSWKSVHFLASSSNWEEKLDNYERTFQTNSQEKIFDDSMGGNSMFSVPIDKHGWYGEGRVLPMRMEDAKIDKFFFAGDDLNHLKLGSIIKEIKAPMNNINIEASIKL